MNSPKGLEGWLDQRHPSRPINNGEVLLHWFPVSKGKWCPGVIFFAQSWKHLLILNFSLFHVIDQFVISPNIHAQVTCLCFEEKLYNKQIW